jgi:phosphoribosylglycinamide formyltransferase-1
MANPFPIAVLISGGGTTLRNLLEKCDQGELDIDVRLVISSSPRAGGLAFAAARRIPTLVVEQRKYASPETFRDAVFAPCRDAGAELVVMGGYLKHVPIPADFENRVLNIHPSLIPAFCGKGMYGLRVHEAVLEYGVKLTGCTVHFVDNEYDHGPILLQRPVVVADDDTPETLQKRVFATECEALPEAIRLIAAGRVVVNGRHVLVR